MNIEDQYYKLDQRLEEQGQHLSRLTTAILGDQDMGIQGLLQRQEEDERFKQEILDSTTNITTNQQKMLDRLDKHYKMINSNSIEIQSLKQFYGVWTSIGKMKRKTVIFLGGIASFITSLTVFWEKIKQFLADLFHL